MVGKDLDTLIYLMHVTVISMNVLIARKNKKYMGYF